MLVEVVVLVEAVELFEEVVLVEVKIIAYNYSEFYVLSQIFLL